MSYHRNQGEIKIRRLGDGNRFWSDYYIKNKPARNDFNKVPLA